MNKILRSIKWRFFVRPIGRLILCTWKQPHISSFEETMNELMTTQKSLCRFGNGEFDVILGGSIGFQHIDNRLGTRLLEILHSKNPNVMVAIMDYLNEYRDISASERVFAYVWRHEYALRAKRMLGSNTSYWRANISRPYTSFEGMNVSQHIDTLKKIWTNEILYVIEGAKSRVGVGNTLFDNARAVKRILCPAQSAFDKYDEILNLSLKYIPKGAMIYIALGPTATVLAYDLAQFGYRALDLGHLDIEYEYYIRGAKGKIKIPGKYVNEVSGGSVVEDFIIDNEYNKSIICRIE